MYTASINRNNHFAEVEVVWLISNKDFFDKSNTFSICKNVLLTFSLVTAHLPFHHQLIAELTAFAAHVFYMNTFGSILFFSVERPFSICYGMFVHLTLNTFGSNYLKLYETLRVNVNYFLEELVIIWVLYLYFSFVKVSF